MYDRYHYFPIFNKKYAQTFRSSRVFVRQLWQAVQTKGQAEGAHEANALVREGGPTAAETKPTITQQKICAQGKSPIWSTCLPTPNLISRFPRRTTTDSSTSATSACWASNEGACWWTTWPNATLRSDQTPCLSWTCPSWKLPETTFASIVIRWLILSSSCGLSHIISRSKVYKSSSKRKAHILKNHPGSELPMSNRRKGGVPDIPGVPNPTYSQTVGSVTTNPHGCPWCHKQYASKAKLLQHQRKKHSDLVIHGSCSVRVNIWTNKNRFYRHLNNLQHKQSKAHQRVIVASESSSEPDPKPSKFIVNGEGIEVIQIQGDNGSLISAVNLLAAGERSKLNCLLFWWIYKFYFLFSWVPSEWWNGPLSWGQNLHWHICFETAFKGRILLLKLTRIKYWIMKSLQKTGRKILKILPLFPVTQFKWLQIIVCIFL